MLQGSNIDNIRDGINASELQKQSSDIYATDNALVNAIAMSTHHDKPIGDIMAHSPEECATGSSKSKSAKFPAVVNDLQKTATCNTIA